MRRISKYEARNRKQVRRFEIGMTETVDQNLCHRGRCRSGFDVLLIRILDFVLVSNFVLRIGDLDNEMSPTSRNSI